MGNENYDSEDKKYEAPLDKVDTSKRGRILYLEKQILSNAPSDAWMIGGRSFRDEKKD